jgi:intracellular multiplication protein IcmD
MNIKKKMSIAGLMLMFIVGSVYAAGPAAVKDVATQITSSFSNLAKLITASAYVSGAGLFMVAIFQFRQHKENPTQTPLSKPMLFLAIAATLIFFPTVVGITEGTIFGPGKAQPGGPTGVIPVQNLLG